MVTDPSQTSSSPTQITEAQPPSGYLVRHNDTIVGIFDNENDATDAMHGYQMQNDIAIDDTLDVLQLV